MVVRRGFWGWFSRKNANRTGARARSGGPPWEVGERRLKVRERAEPASESQREPRRALGSWHAVSDYWMACACRLACLRMLVLVVRVSAGGLQLYHMQSWQTHGMYMHTPYIHAHTYNTTCVHTVTQHAWSLHLSGGGHAHDGWAAALSLTCSAGCRSNNNDVRVRVQTDSQGSHCS